MAKIPAHRVFVQSAAAATDRILTGGRSMRNKWVVVGGILVALGAAFLVFSLYDGSEGQEGPSEARKRRDLLVWRLKEGDERLKRGDVQGALEAHRESLAIAKLGAEQDPANATWQRDQAIIHFRLSFDLKEAGSLGEAREHAEACVAIYRKLADQDPQWRSELEQMEAYLAQMDQGTR